MGETRAITKDLMQVRIADGLRSYIGPGRQYSYDEAADAIGADVRTVQSWVLGETAPCVFKLMRLFAWLGPSFADMVLAPAGLCAVPAAAPAADDFATNAAAAVAAAGFAEAFLDGRVDHGERLRLLPVVRTAHARLGAWLAACDPQHQGAGR